MFDLDGRRAVVLGGAGQLGAPICHGLAARGARVVVSDLDAAACRRVCEGLPARPGGEPFFVQADLAEEKDVADLASRCAARLGHVDILVFCIGLTSAVSLDGYAVPFAQQTLTAWKRALAVNLDSAFLAAKAFHPLLAASPHASMILLSSIYGSLGANLHLYDDTTMNNPLAYGASKGGLEQLMRYLAVQWAPGIRVNCVSPGGIRRNQDPRFVARYEAMTPMGRMGAPDDVVGPVVFLAGDAARYITGQNLLVDGGGSAW